MSFDKDLIRITANIEKTMDIEYRSAVVDVFNRVVLETPFDTGAAKASWLVGASNTGAVGTVQQRFTTSDVLPIGRQSVLFSNLPYIKRLAEGWSAQAANGWIQRIVQTWPQTVKKYER